jgi:RecB family endonuclease NucS
VAHSILNPSIDDTLDFITMYHTSKPDKTMLILLGECHIDYRGRARSLLDWGERLYVIKQDGTILVHQPSMREPINWQPAGSITKFSKIKNELIIRSRHEKPPEKMKVIFRKILTATCSTLRDHATLVISGMELDVVNDIISNPDTIEEGLRVCKREKHVKSGKIDLYCFDKNHIPVIIEVKRSTATISAVHQLRMYVNDIKHDFEGAEVRGILCAPHIPDMVKHLLVDYGLEWREVERRVVIPDDFQTTLQEFIM